MSVVQKFAAGLSALIVFGLVFIHGAGLPQKLHAEQSERMVVSRIETPVPTRTDESDDADFPSAAEPDPENASPNAMQVMTPATPHIADSEILVAEEFVEQPVFDKVAEPAATAQEIAVAETAIDLPVTTVVSKVEAARLAADQCQQRIDRAMTGYQITFADSSEEISRGVARLLTDLSFQFEACDEVLVEIRGHTDARGGADANDALSLRRANAVMAFLDRIGVGDIKMSATGFGETQPIASNNTADGRTRNRRIDFVVSPIATDDDLEAVLGNPPQESD